MEVPVSLMIYDYDTCLENYQQLEQMLIQRREMQAPAPIIEQLEIMTLEALERFQRARQALDKIPLTVLLQERQRLGRSQPALPQCVVS